MPVNTVVMAKQLSNKENTSTGKGVGKPKGG